MTLSRTTRRFPHRKQSIQAAFCDIFLFPSGRGHYIMWSQAQFTERGYYIMEMKIATRYCADQEGNQRCFHYFLTVDQEEMPRLFCENYGIRISEEQGGEAAISGITTSAARIDELLTMLVDNRVGPAGLSDVVADWL